MEATASHGVRHTEPIVLLTASDQPVAKAYTYVTHNKHMRRTSMLFSAGFERAIPAKQAVADIRLRRHGPRDRLVSVICALLIGRWSIHVATRCKGWLRGRLLVGIAGSNPAGGQGCL